MTKSIMDPEERAKNLLSNYVVRELVDDFSVVPEEVKLTILQKTPKQFIKERVLGGGKIFYYAPHGYTKKCLNFIFNFNVSNEVISKEYLAYKETYNDYKDPKCVKSPTGKLIPIQKTRDVTEAEVTMKFTIKRQNGAEIVRTVHASHKGYQNPATTRGDIMQSAFSKSWTKFAQTFGIAADLEGDMREEPSKEETASDFMEGEIVAENTKAFDKW